ncbi:hypothetical protein [Mycolicibacterium komossense]|uniref:hypothetical protein n=1 Tax=Mycolicibacterium komossense TaxID=1779 RepID=UPI0021F25759|nr:hypothetical protein [Mycolicibacterium komossense]
MNAPLSLLLLIVVLLAPFALVAVLAARSRGSHFLRGHLDQMRYTNRDVARLVEEGDADGRRLDHELDAIRTRFEQQPSWPTSGVRSDSR